MRDLQGEFKVSRTVAVAHVKAIGLHLDFMKPLTKNAVRYGRCFAMLGELEEIIESFEYKEENQHDNAK